MSAPVVPDYRPCARYGGVVAQDLGQEVLVYDTSTQKAHCLNGSAALVWKLCDGKSTVTEIALRMEGPSEEEVVWLALEVLEQAALLSSPLPSRAPVGMSRRSLLKNFAYTAAALPLIASVLVPTPALAASATCSGGIECTACKNISATAVCVVGCDGCLGTCSITQADCTDNIATNVTCAECNAMCAENPACSFRAVYL